MVNNIEKPHFSIIYNDTTAFTVNSMSPNSMSSFTFSSNSMSPIMYRQMDFPGFIYAMFYYLSMCLEFSTTCTCVVLGSISYFEKMRKRDNLISLYLYHCVNNVLIHLVTTYIVYYFVNNL